MQNKKIKYLTEAAIIATLYVVLTLVSKPFSLGYVEVRFSEALCVLPFFMPGSVWGLFVGCIISNIFSGSIVDIIVGSLATLIGAYIASKIKIKWLCPLPTVLSNTILIPFVIMSYMNEWHTPTYIFSVAGVFISEMISVYGLGMILLIIFDKRKIIKH